jgi:sugar phosphate isomerase/epimerase
MPDAAQLSVQLYTVRNALAQDFDGTLGRIADFGYRQVEPFMLTNFVDELSEALPKYGLSAPTTHVGFLSGDQAPAFDAAQKLGVRTVIDPFVDPTRWQDADEIARIAGELNAAAETAADFGLRVGYHNHHFELENTFDGVHGLELLADALDPEVVLEVDTYWAYAGGADVPALLARLGERVVAVHVKDGDGSLDTKKQVAVGAGSLPIWNILDAVPDALRVVELDDSEGDLLEAVGDSYAYLTDGRGA